MKNPRVGGKTAFASSWAEMLGCACSCLIFMLLQRPWFWMGNAGRIISSTTHNDKVSYAPRPMRTRYRMPSTHKQMTKVFDAH